MNTRSFRWRTGALVVASLVACGKSPNSQPTEITPPETVPAVAENRPVVRFNESHGLSKPLRDLKPLAPSRGRADQEMPIGTPNFAPKKPVKQDVDAAPEAASNAVQTINPALMPAPLKSFDGLSNADNQSTLGFRVSPPDTDGDVGPNHYVQWINLVFSVYNKNGTKLFGPAAGNTLWQGFSGPCSTNNDGDILVRYDQLADRWVMSQFALTTGAGHQCVAVSKTPDPLGAYYLYDFVVSTGTNDYPKLGLWTDAYYLSFNEFVGSFTGAFAVAFQRDAMLQGLPAASVKFAVKDPANLDEFFTVLPANLEGKTPPPAGSPGIFAMAFDEQTFGPTGNTQADHYNVWKFNVNWANPAAATFTGPTEVASDSFDSNMCDFSRACIVQKGTTNKVDSIAAFTMSRVVYRNYGTHESLAVTHAVDALGNDIAGVRWAEIRSPLGAAPTLFQAGTFAPADGNSRWMSSINMDKDGNLAVGYSVSGPDLFPAVRYAGRLASDPLGTLGQGEAELVAGGASQTAGNRWGDYASLAMDDNDDCTFWFTTMYLAAGDTSWRTRIGSFSFPTCAAAERGTLSGTVNGPNGPIAGAKVNAGVFSTTTGADGKYRLLLAAGTYDVKASQFGFLPQTVAALVVANNATVTQNFTLAAAPKSKVDGFVYDSYSANWPLYARIDITSDGAPAQALYTDPLTGYYNTELLSGSEYSFKVTPLIQGYLPLTQPVVPGPGDTSSSFGIALDLTSCNAPGYELVRTPLTPAVDFEGTFPPAGWTAENATMNCGAAGKPGFDVVSIRTNLTGGTGKFSVADSDACGSSVKMDASLITPALDLSGFKASDSLQVSFKTDFRDLGSQADVDGNTGMAWTNLKQFRGTTFRGPRTETVTTNTLNGAAAAKVRFHYVAGFHWWWELDDVSFAKASCQYRIGGLAVGHVYDANTNRALNGAKVAVAGGASTTSFATPGDSAQDDGLYLVHLRGARDVTASLSRYQSLTTRVVPQVNGVVEKNFNLAAGRLSASPISLQARVTFGETGNTNLVLTNSGGAPANFNFIEIEAPPATLANGPFAPTGRRTAPKDIDSVDGKGVKIAFDKLEIPTILNAGEVTGGFTTGLAGAWGVGFNSQTNDVWLGNISGLMGDNKNYRFTTSGVNTNDTVDFSVYANTFAADMAYNSRTRTFWQVNVGGDNCVHEFNPATKLVTGNKICPAFGTSERGLAYDPITDTYYAGSWNDGIVHQFDATGRLLRSVQVQVNVSGLAYNPVTQHLFALANDSAEKPDVVVLNAADGLKPIGSFEIATGATAAFAAFEQAGMEMDCSGKLYAMNQSQKRVFVANTGEGVSCAGGIPWLSTNPSQGTVLSNGSLTSVVTFDSRNIVPGFRRAQLLVDSDTPYEVPTLGVYFTAAFKDVAASYYADAAIHGLTGARITVGCGGAKFCPDTALSRAVMSVVLLRSKRGADYRPPAATGIVFDDVQPETFAADFIEEAARSGISTGCGAGKFCPEAAVLRKEMAVFLLRTLEGTTYMPPPAVGLFSDVDDDPFKPWIDEVARRGYTIGCGGSNFCPNAPLTRAEMAVWLVKAFKFPTQP
jgi:Carboxypeptidase regulatory-like domain/S-layer homology domain